MICLAEPPIFVKSSSEQVTAVALPLRNRSRSMPLHHPRMAAAPSVQRLCTHCAKPLSQFHTGRLEISCDCIGCLSVPKSHKSATGFSDAFRMIRRGHKSTNTNETVYGLYSTIIAGSWLDPIRFFENVALIQLHRFTISLIYKRSLLLFFYLILKINTPRFLEYFLKLLTELNSTKLAYL